MSKRRNRMNLLKFELFYNTNKHDLDLDIR